MSPPFSSALLAWYFVACGFGYIATKIGLQYGAVHIPVAEVCFGLLCLLRLSFY